MVKLILLGAVVLSIVLSIILYFVFFSSSDSNTATKVDDIETEGAERAEETSSGPEPLNLNMTASSDVKGKKGSSKPIGEAVVLPKAKLTKLIIKGEGRDQGWGNECGFLQIIIQDNQNGELTEVYKKDIKLPRNDKAYKNIDQEHPLDLTVESGAKLIAKAVGPWPGCQGLIKKGTSVAVEGDIMETFENIPVPYNG